jgi:hypothetical protein
MTLAAGNEPCFEVLAKRNNDMAPFTTTSSAARTALIYITVGSLVVIWTGVWFIYLLNNPPESAWPNYWCGGLVVSGFTLIAIGLGLGRIGKEAQRADVPTAAVVAPTVPTTSNGTPVATVQPVQPVIETPVVANNSNQQPVHVR